VTPDGLKLVLETRLYGRVGALELFRAPVGCRPARLDGIYVRSADPNSENRVVDVAQNQTVDWLLIATERYQICILSYNTATGELVTLAGGSVRRGTHAKLVGDTQCLLTQLYQNFFIAPLQTKNDVGKPLPVGFQVKVDPLARIIGVHQVRCDA